jgi:hypothetical protein
MVMTRQRDNGTKPMTIPLPLSAVPVSSKLPPLPCTTRRPDNADNKTTRKQDNGTKPTTRPQDYETATRTREQGNL